MPRSWPGLRKRRQALPDALLRGNSGTLQRRRVGIRDREGVHQGIHVTGIERQEADAFRAQFYVPDASQVVQGGLAGSV
jgi:hypothetical protein